jgi:hypothetical protein
MRGELRAWREAADFRERQFPPVALGRRRGEPDGMGVEFGGGCIERERLACGEAVADGGGVGGFLEPIVEDAGVGGVRFAE